MVSSKAATVAQFLAESDPEVRPALQAFQRLVRRAVPGARGRMAYGMPTFELRGAPFAAFTAQKRYLAFYVDPELLAAHRRELAGLDCGKCCIRGRRLEQYPLDVLEAIVREAARRATAAAHGPAAHGPAAHGPAARGAAARESGARRRGSRR